MKILALVLILMCLFLMILVGVFLLIRTLDGADMGDEESHHDSYL